MATITVRGLDDSVKRAIAEQARAHGRSMEAEVRHILTESMQRQRRNIGAAFLDTFQDLGGVEVEVPSRSQRRRVPEFE